MNSIRQKELESNFDAIRIEEVVQRNGDTILIEAHIETLEEVLSEQYDYALDKYIHNPMKTVSYLTLSSMEKRRNRCINPESYKEIEQLKPSNRNQHRNYL